MSTEYVFFYPAACIDIVALLFLVHLVMTVGYSIISYTKCAASVYFLRSVMFSKTEKCLR